MEESTDNLTPKEFGPNLTPKEFATPMTKFNKMSMELFMNNHHYSKYLSKTDPQKYEEFAEYRKTLIKYHDGIMGITQQLLSNPKKQWNHDITETFHHFTKSCIKYLENQELEQYTKDSYSDDGDEDETMFDEKFMNSTENTADFSKTRDVKKSERSDFPKSFWGKQIHKSINKVLPSDNLSRDFVAFSGKKVIQYRGPRSPKNIFDDK